MQVIASPRLLVHKNVGLRACNSSNAAPKIGTKEETRDNGSMPAELREAKHEEQDVDL